MSSITSYFKTNPPVQKRVVQAGAPESPSVLDQSPLKNDEKVGATSADEQDFIDVFVSIAKGPLFKGKQTSNRRVAVFGQKYYWGEDVSHPLSALPTSFKKWCVAHGYTSKCNSVVVNVYDEPRHNIGWHMDTTVRLKNPQVTSISFAVNRQDRDKELAELEFRWPSKQDAAKKTIKKETLQHGTVVKFDAEKHHKKSCEHRVAKTAFPRVNVTMRLLNK